MNEGCYLLLLCRLAVNDLLDLSCVLHTSSLGVPILASVYIRRRSLTREEEENHNHNISRDTLLEILHQALDQVYSAESDAVVQPHTHSTGP